MCVVSRSPFPQTRDEYRARIMEDLFRLVQHIEADDNEHSRAEALARGLHYDVREFFNRARWKPTPVYDGLRARVPLGSPLTLLIQFHGGEDGRRTVQGRVQAIHHPGSSNDGAEFLIVPKGCRSPRRYWYRVGVESALTVYPGWIAGQALERTRPLYDHAVTPPVRYDS
ncbi:hypothetical protein GCM10025871_33560 [Deinococcus metallilatus]|nr:hypothetical protein GCM10025871_33560 [Deinococcus metallilatus]